MRLRLTRESMCEILLYPPPLPLFVSYPPFLLSLSLSVSLCLSLSLSVSLCLSLSLSPSLSLVAGSSRMTLMSYMQVIYYKI